MKNKYELQIGGRTLTATLTDIAGQANGSILLRYGDTVVLATCTMSKEERDDIDYFPLFVEYEERFYAAGKISGSRYTRREGKPSERATLIGRMIDRSIRPLFPESLKKEVQVIVTCLSWDEENDPSVLGALATSLALSISDIPWKGPLSTVKIGRSDKVILNPTYQEIEEGDMEIVFTGFLDEKGEYHTNMIEGNFNEISEEVLLESFNLASQATEKLEKFQKEIIEENKVDKIHLEEKESYPEIEKKVNEIVKEKLEEAVFSLEKEKMEKIEEEIKESFEEEDIKEAFNFLQEKKKEIVRDSILKKNVRPDKRGEEEIRELKMQTSFLPRTHGTGLFCRGETKSLSIVTLGAPGEQQLYDQMEKEGKKRFMHHYNFPPYSVGEVKPLRGPGRRDIGHGMLGEKAIDPILPEIDDFPYTIRVVSEILSSNGSTSMAATTSASLALMDAGVPIKRPVTGISIGLITDKEGNYRLLTDIQGPEDHVGDMDLKIAGTREGITAAQMDVKISGINGKILKEALERAKKTRNYILDEMEKVIEGPRKELSPYAPCIITIQIDPEKIGTVIGPGGKVINEIIEGTEASIDIEDSGRIFITSESKESAKKAEEWIKGLTREVKEGEIFQGKVKKIFPFGCVVEILPGQEGLCHISELASYHVKEVEDIVKIGDIIPVKVLKTDREGKISLSLKEAKKEVK